MTYVELYAVSADVTTCHRCNKLLSAGTDPLRRQNKPKWRLCRFYTTARLHYPLGFAEHASHAPCKYQEETGVGPCLAHKVPLDGVEDEGPNECVLRPIDPATGKPTLDPEPVYNGEPKQWVVPA